MTFQVIVGRGATASRTALLLAADGDRVRMISRTAGGPEHPLIERVAADAADARTLIPLVEGADTLINTAAPAYQAWPAEFPKLSASLLEAVGNAGASYVMLGNHYAYGPVDGPLTPDLPLLATGPKGRARARVWEEAHDSGVRVTEVRAGQFYGAGAFSVFSLMVQPHVLAGTLGLVSQEVDIPHSYTSIGDAARTLAAVAKDERAFGRAWHAPTVTLSARQLAVRLAELAGAPEPRLEQLTEREVSLLGLTDPFWNELHEVLLTPGLPFVVDYSDTERTFGITATPADEVLKELLN